MPFPYIWLADEGRMEKNVPLKSCGFYRIERTVIFFEDLKIKKDSLYLSHKVDFQFALKRKDVCSNIRMEA